MLAAGGGHESCLNILLKAATAIAPHDQSCLNVADVNGSSATHYACRAGEAGALALLADAGACLDLPSGASDVGNALHPAHIAVVYGFLFCLEVLAARNADLEATDGDGETVLSLAVQCGSEACTEYLLSGAVAGPGPGENHDGGNKGTPLVDPNHPGRGQERPLNSAARRGRLSFLSLLLRAGADPMASDRDGETAVHAAARCGQAAVIEVLAQAAVGGGEERATLRDGGGLDSLWCMTTNKGETATFIAASEGHVGVCKALHGMGVLDPSRPNVDGVTPMVAAALAGHVEVNVFQCDRCYTTTLDNTLFTLATRV